MAEQPHPWGERTLEVTPQDPWAEPPQHTRPIAPDQFPGAGAVPREAGPGQSVSGQTVSGAPAAEPPRSRKSLGAQLRLLRRGGEWSSAAVLFAFICWGVWTISGQGNLTTPVLVIVVTMLVALGLFALSRLVGRIVLERQFARVRRTATGSHLVVAVFLVGVGFAFLRQVSWVMTAWGWVTGLR